MSRLISTHLSIFNWFGRENRVNVMLVYCEKDTKEAQLIHSGERPFMCKVCDAVFDRIDYREWYKRINTGQRPFNCELCKSEYDNIQRHILNNTGERLFKCKVCDADSDRNLRSKGTRAFSNWLTIIFTLPVIRVFQYIRKVYEEPTVAPMLGLAAYKGITVIACVRACMRACVRVCRGRLIVADGNQKNVLVFQVWDEQNVAY